MKREHGRDTVIFVLGDIIMMATALWCAIALRYLEIPAWGLLEPHMLPFGVLFLLSLVVFYVSGIYEPQTIVLKSRIPAILFNASIVNAIFGLGLFYFFPFVGIAPKTTLLLYLSIAFTLLLLWRLYGGQTLGVKQKAPAILIGGGEEMKKLVDVVNNSSFYGMSFVQTINLDRNDHVDLDRDVFPILRRTQIHTIVADLAHPEIGAHLPKLQQLQFQGVTFLDQSQVYEDIFDRVPLSLIGYGWLLEHISFRTHFGYDLLKRLMDILLSFFLLLLSLIVYPFVALAIKLEDGGPVFLLQERVGEGNSRFTIVKFRSMTTSDKGKWVVANDPRITKVGSFLRVSRLDELPQLWNVLMGDLSLIGPRPELPDLVKYYNAVIPYYNVRHLVKPGLSGWAQVHHEKPPHSVEETKEKLSYDLYYIKNRNFMLDVKIALKTVKTLLSRTGV